MELEGLKRCLDHIQTKGIGISELVTDRHCQVKKFMREQNPEIRHSFDVWHVAKGEQICTKYIYCIYVTFLFLLTSNSQTQFNQIFLHKFYLLVCTTLIDVFSLDKGSFG